MWQLEMNYRLAFLYRATGERKAELFPFVTCANGQMLFFIFIFLFYYLPLPISCLFEDLYRMRKD